MGTLMDTLRDVAKEVRRWPTRTCGECGGCHHRMYETYEDSWDRTFAEQKCHSCGGEGTIGGGQPSLTLYFQTTKDRDKFKARTLRMHGITWEDEGNNIMESK